MDRTRTRLWDVLRMGINPGRHRENTEGTARVAAKATPVQYKSNCRGTPHHSILTQVTDQVSLCTGMANHRGEQGAECTVCQAPHRGQGWISLGILRAQSHQRWILMPRPGSVASVIVMDMGRL